MRHACGEGDNGVGAGAAGGHNGANKNVERRFLMVYFYNSRVSLHLV